MRRVSAAHNIVLVLILVVVVVVFIDLCGEPLFVRGLIQRFWPDDLAIERMGGFRPSVRAQYLVVCARAGVTFIVAETNTRAFEPVPEDLLPSEIFVFKKLVSRGTLEPGGNVVCPFFEDALCHDLAHVRIVDRAAQGMFDSVVWKAVVILGWRVADRFRDQERVPYRVQVCGGIRSAQRGAKHTKKHTRLSLVKYDFIAVPASVSSGEVKRLVKVTHKVDQELEGFVRHVCLLS